MPNTSQGHVTRCNVTEAVSGLRAIGNVENRGVPGCACVGLCPER